MNRSSLPLLGLVIPAALLAAWWLAAHSGGIAPVLLPSPEAVWEAFVRMAADGSLAAHIGMSAMRTMTGFVLAAAFGIGCGVWFAVRPAAAAASHFVIEFLRLTPPLALIPVLILWLGIDEAPKIAIVFLSSFFPIYLSALTAVKGIDPKLAEVAELLRFTSAERFRMLTLPAAMPGILAGLRMGFGYSWRALVGAELIGAGFSHYGELRIRQDRRRVRRHLHDRGARHCGRCRDLEARFGALAPHFGSCVDGEG